MSVALLVDALAAPLRELPFLRDTIRRLFDPPFLVDRLLYPYLRFGILRRQIQNRLQRPFFSKILKKFL